MISANANTTVTHMQLTAVQYMERGWSPIPILFKQKKPGFNNVLLHDWNRYEFNAHHFEGQSNIGIKLGEPSGGLVDIDLDCPEAVRLAEHFLPHTAARFGRNMNSEHWLYVVKGTKSATWQDSDSSGKKMILELRSTGMQTVFPPSVHESGEPIRWLEGGDPREFSEDDLKRACARLAAAVLTLRLYVTKARNMFVGPFTGWLRKGGMTAEDTTDFIMKVVHASGDDEPRNREDYIRRTNLKFDTERGEVSGRNALVEMGCDASTLTAIGKWLGLEHKNVSLDVAMRCTDSGNAQHLVETHGDEIRYCSPMDSWYFWNSYHWRKDEHNQIVRITKIAVHEHIEEVNKSRGSRELLNWSTKSLNWSKLTAMIKLAQPEVPIAYEHFDCHPWLLNVKNGTINLQTGELQPHCPEDFLTKLVPIAYDPGATCPRWEQFLLEIMNGDQERVQFLQRAVGYSLTGSVEEHCLFICHGIGANGKSVFLNMLSRLLEDYYHQADFRSFLSRDQVGGEVRNDLAALAGKRLVAASEANQKVRVDEALIKSLTGGDPITARFLFKEHFTYRPMFKIWLAANAKPEIRGQDEGIWRRVRLIPFEVSFPDGKRDPKLTEKLCEELPGILAWAVRGCLEWQHAGLNPPKAVVEATSDYREESDFLGGFFAEKITIDPLGNETFAKLYIAYTAWCTEQRQDPVKSRTFGTLLGERGFKKGIQWTGIKNAQCYLGLSLKMDEEEVEF